ncbi:MAG: hypothetical protein DHS20C04_05940 [Hyphococcus sp.]|nr:MAG: hypothetical protein DHS20C04_05940 [Marinicaulis sp.]
MLSFFAATHAAVRVSTPYTIEPGGFYIIDVVVNDRHSLKFIVDTAAQKTSLFPMAAKALELQPVPGGTTFVQGVNGSIKAEFVLVDSIEVAGERMLQFSAAVTPELVNFDNIGGILGLDFLARYAIEFDPASGMFSLHKQSANLESIKNSGSVLPLQKLRTGFLSVQAKINGINILALLDTGARRNVVNWRTARRLGIGWSDQRLQKDESIIGATGKKSKAVKKFRADEIVVGDQLWTDQSVSVVDLRVFRALNVENQPTAVFGARVFESRHFLVDFGNLELVFFE